MSFSGIVRSGYIFKGTGICLALAALVALSGCWVESINPLYEDGLLSSKDPDVVFDNRLTGSWSVIDDKCTITLAISAKGDIYDLESTQQGEGCGSAGEKSRKQGRLVRLDTSYFLDVSPMPEDVCDECLAKHTIYQVKIDNGFSLTPIDSDWLGKALAAKTVSLSTLPDDADTITASSKDLKAFCRRFAGEKAVFKPTFTFQRK
jgi:hypothetical protein